VKTPIRLLLFCLFECIGSIFFSQTAGKSVVIGSMISKPNAILILNPPDGNQIRAHRNQDRDCVIAMTLCRVFTPSYKSALTFKRYLYRKKLERIFQSTIGRKYYGLTP